MAAANYSACLREVLKHEGGYANHPKDPGGATMRGVTQAVYDAYRFRRNLPKRSVRAIDESELQAIYRKQYWDVVRGDALPAGVDLAVFDFAVNSGPSRAAKSLQVVLGVTPDGAIGERTLAAIELKPPAQLVNALCDRRLAFLKKLPTWPTFDVGWLRRVEQVKTRGRAMASIHYEPKSQVGPVDVQPATEPAGQKAEPVLPADTERRDELIAIGAGGSGIVATILGAINSPYGLAGLAILAFAGLAVWWMWPRRKMPELAP